MIMMFIKQMMVIINKYFNEIDHINAQIRKWFTNMRVSQLIRCTH